MKWITSNKRKKHQRAINRYVRLINLNVYNDDLWRGRFYIHQIDAQFYRDKDHNTLYVCLECVDRLTGKTWQKWSSVNEWIFLNGVDVWRMMNDFIIEQIKVWEEVPDPRDATYDFRKDKH